MTALSQSWDWFDGRIFLQSHKTGCKRHVGHRATKPPASQPASLQSYGQVIFKDRLGLTTKPRYRFLSYHGNGKPVNPSIHTMFRHLVLGCCCCCCWWCWLLWRWKLYPPIYLLIQSTATTTTREQNLRRKTKFETHKIKKKLYTRRILNEFV